MTARSSDFSLMRSNNKVTARAPKRDFDWCMVVKGGSKSVKREYYHNQ